MKAKQKKETILKKVTKHLKEDQKTFKKEGADDRKLVREINRSKKRK